jgi:hypothetical protein
MTEQGQRVLVVDDPACQLKSIPLAGFARP